MSKTLGRTLNLVDTLLSEARRLHQLGLNQHAATLLQKLTAFQQLPSSIAEAVQSLLADIQFRLGQFQRARRHLRAALAHQPASADYHYRLALATEEDPQANPDLALSTYARTVKLDPKNPHYWCDYAYALLNAEDTEAGLKALRKAQQLAPNDPEILSAVVRGLNGAGQEEEARGLLRSALFRNSRDFRFRNLWQRFQFDLLHARQQKTSRPRELTANERAAILPFTPRRKKEMKLGTRTLRLDGPATLQGPTAPTPRRSRSPKK